MLRGAPINKRASVRALSFSLRASLRGFKLGGLTAYCLLYCCQQDDAAGRRCALGGLVCALPASAYMCVCVCVCVCVCATSNVCVGVSAWRCRTHNYTQHTSTLTCVLSKRACVCERKTDRLEGTKRRRQKGRKQRQTQRNMRDRQRCTQMHTSTAKR